jgi:xylose isomerase
MADALGIFGSIDINRGDPQNGWDTDQFHNDPLDMTLAMYRILKAGGFTTGGFNFDAKVRRQSIDPADMFHGHVGGLDLLARTLLAAAKIIEHGGIDKFVEQRYAKWNGELAQKIFAKDASLATISDWALQNNINPKPTSGRQEYLENLINRFV